MDNLTKVGMKRVEKYAYPVRYTSELHSVVKSGAVAQGRSINSYIAHLLCESLIRYPTLDCLPVVLQQANTSFGIRITSELQQGLTTSAHAVDKDRSFNQEIVGRLMLMTTPSRQTLIDAWSLLNQAISTHINHHASNPQCGQDLQEKREAFEWHLKHSLAVETV